jgi:hypothetical protein
MARLYGAGGGGAGGVITSLSSVQCGGGGGGGAYLESQITATPGSTLTVTVGFGGTGGLGATGISANETGAGTTGIANGGDTRVAGLITPFATLIAGGGHAALGLAGDGTTVSNQPDVGGTGGIPTPSTTIPAQQFVALGGQQGSNGNSNTGLSGSGGACPNGGAGGAAGTCSFGLALSMIAPTPGLQPGGGGAGGSLFGANQDPYDGTSGANGLVVLTFY